MAVYQALLLNTVVPQIQAAQAGDSYVMVVNATTPALRITQTGTGNALEVEDSANPDATPFVVTAAGDVGIGLSSPTAKLDVNNGANSELRVSTSGSGYLQVGQFTNGAFIGTSSSDANAGLLRLGTAGTTRATLDTSGNLGLGVTPSAWGSGYKALQVGYAALSNPSATYDSLSLTANLFYDGTNWKFIETQQANRLSTVDGVWTWEYATGNAGATAALSTQMTLDASGNLGVGTTSPLSVAGYTFVDLLGSTGAQYRVRTSTVDLRIGASATDAFVSSTNSALWFGTNNTERARITSGGDFYFGVAGTNSGVVYIQTGTGAGGRIIDAIDVLGARYFEVQTDGDVYNTNGTYGTISDQKMKTDIVDAGSQWSDIKALRFRKFKMKNDPQQIVQLGVVAQEVEQTSPGLVDEHQDRDAEGNDLGTTTKSVKTSVLLMKAAVALQEAMARIETLEAEVAALKGA
jgi:hypothetical protein